MRHNTGGKDATIHIVTDATHTLHINQGPAYLRNYGKNMVQTQLMAYIDDDNQFDDDFFARLCMIYTEQAIEQTRYICIAHEIDGHTRASRSLGALGMSAWTGRPTWNTDQITIRTDISIASSNFLFGPTWIFVVYPFDKNVPIIYEDLVMTQAMTLGGIQIHCHPEIHIYHYHYNANTLTRLYINTAYRAYCKGKHRIILMNMQNIFTKIIFFGIGLRLQTIYFVCIMLIYIPKIGYTQTLYNIYGLLRGTFAGLHSIVAPDSPYRYAYHEDKKS